MTVCLRLYFKKNCQNCTKDKIVFISKLISYSFTKALSFIQTLPESCILQDWSVSNHKAKYRGNIKGLCLVPRFSVPKLENGTLTSFSSVLSYCV